MELVFISARGDRLPLVSNSLFEITGVDGMTAANATIASAVVGGADGDVVSNVQAYARGIEIYLRVKSGVSVEEMKRAVLRVVKIKQRGSLEWKQDGRAVTISGIVEAVEMPRWTDSVTMQITLYCSQPFWEDVAYIVQQISEAVDVHYFTDNEMDMLYFPAEGIALGEYDTTRTKQFHNSGDVDVGMEISIVAYGDVTNPIIYNDDGDFLGIGYGDGAKQVKLAAGDNVVITTHKGRKTITMNGESLLSKLRPKSKWLQLRAGDNQFTINSDDDSTTNMTFSLIYKQRYI